MTTVLSSTIRTFFGGLNDILFSWLELYVGIGGFEEAVVSEADRFKVVFVSPVVSILSMSISVVFLSKLVLG